MSSRDSVRDVLIEVLKGVMHTDSLRHEELMSTLERQYKAKGEKRIVPPPEGAFRDDQIRTGMFSLARDIPGLLWIEQRARGSVKETWYNFDRSLFRESPPALFVFWYGEYKRLRSFQASGYRRELNSRAYDGKLQEAPEWFLDWARRKWERLYPEEACPTFLYVPPEQEEERGEAVESTKSGEDAEQVWSVTEADMNELRCRFTHHPPSGDQQRRYKSIRTLAHSLAVRIVKYTPLGSREQSIALRKLEEAVMWADSAIARREENPEAEE